MLKKSSTPEALGDEQVKEILLRFNYIDPEDLKKAEEYAQTSTASFIDYFIQNELLTTELLGQAIAESFNVPYFNLGINPPSQENIDKIPEEIAKKHRIILVSDEDDSVTIATDTPSQNDLDYVLKKHFHRKQTKITFSLSEDIDKALVKYRKSLEARFVQLINKQHGVAPEIINEILEDAITYRSSDIHFEPHNEKVVIRFRIDGVLHEVGRIPIEYYKQILNRIKVQGRLRIDEHFVPQDGAIRYEKDGREIDLRISIAPTIAGEKIVIRVLSQYVQDFTLSDLGLSASDQQLIQNAANEPFGMILVTGPTGSGKTTTLYALLKAINRPDINITSIEDPVEYQLLGINQIQVDSQNISFAKGLRSIVRQDPDVILVGEIRDQETAEIAVNIALTGHLLFSTFHSNDAATTIPRLLDMNIEPFLLASTINLIVAQRLVRKICPSCRYSMTIELDYIEKFIPNAGKYFPEKTTLYSSKGCDACSDTGYLGRTAIYEFIRTTKELKELMLHNPSTKEIWSLAQKQGSNSLFEDGLKKVLSGTTTIEELVRVVSPPED